MAQRTHLKGGTIVTMDPSLGILPSGDILIEGGRIAEVAPEIRADGAEVIDASHRIVLPGLVDTHRHVWQTALRGIAADWTLKQYMREIRFRRAPIYRPEDIYAGNYVGMLEAINAGVTTVFDYAQVMNSPDHAAAELQGLRDSGARVVFGYGFNEVPLETPYFRTVAERIAHAAELRRKEFSSDGQLVTMAITISDFPIGGIERAEVELRAARELGLRVSLHTNTWQYPQRVPEVQVFREHGLLGPDLLFVHTNLSTDEEIRLIAESGGAIASTPETEMQCCMGPAVIGRFMRYGGLPTFGADIISNQSGDLLVQARLGLQTQRMLDNEPILKQGRGPETLTLTTRDAFQGLTINGAKALGLDRKIGTLTPGKDADIVLVRTDDINMVPVNDPIAAVLFHSHPGNVDTVLVAGRIVKRHGELAADMAKARRLIAESQAYVLESIRERSTTPPPGYKA